MPFISKQEADPPADAPADTLADLDTPAKRELSDEVKEAKKKITPEEFEVWNRNLSPEWEAVKERHHRQQREKEAAALEAKEREEAEAMEKKLQDAMLSN